MTGEVPRVCGKDLVAPKLSITLTGSPPRVREGRNRRIPRPNSIRITPACAGRTVEVYQAWTGERDHPRVCGKDDVKHHVDCAKLGSPPRVREGLAPMVSARPSAEDHPRVCGKDRQSAIAPRALSRITPACAGRTARHDVWLYLVEDHPRVCGKDRKISIDAGDVIGSPPRVREGQVRRLVAP